MAFEEAEYQVFHGVCPDFDNEARRGAKGVSFIGSTPKMYGDWLANACHKALRNSGSDERIVFVNAWNEWAEGAYLEPDRHNGYAFLRETARVLQRRNLSDDSQLALGAFTTQPVIGSETSAVPDAMPQLFRKVRLKAAATFERLTDVIRPD
jgi:lipopolysaccharide biosynthesis protein